MGNDATAVSSDSLGRLDVVDLAAGIPGITDIMTSAAGDWTVVVE